MARPGDDEGPVGEVPGGRGVGPDQEGDRGRARPAGGRDRGPHPGADRLFPTPVAGQVKALLVDLYDTIVRADWSEMAALVAARLGVPAEALRRAFDVTRPDRGAGRFGGVAGNL